MKFLTVLFRNLNSGSIATLAGVGWKEGTEAAITDAGWPMGVVRNKQGDLIVVDYHGNRIWRIDSGGILHTFAGDGVPGFRGDGGPAREARFLYPHDLCLDVEGNLFLSDLGNYRIRRIDAKTGVITTVCGSGVRGRAGDGGPAMEAQLDVSCGVAVDREGNLYIADEYSCTVRRVDRRGIINRFAGIGIGGYNGDGIPALQAALYHPEHLAFDSQSELYICDNSNDRIRKVDRNGIITTVWGSTFPVGVDVGRYRGSRGDGGAADQASLMMPDSLFIDVHDNIYVGEKYGYRVRRLDARTGVVSTAVGTGVPGFGEDGDIGERTQVNSCEAGLWADPDGSVIWSDCSGRLRRVDGRTRRVTTLLGGSSVGDGGRAASAFLCGPAGMAVARDGSIYFADVWNQRVRVIHLETAVIRTVAGDGARAYGGDGGPATRAHLGNPFDVAVDQAGNLYIADSRYARIRRVDPHGFITTCVGNGFPWDLGDGGPAISASITSPVSVAIDPEGNLYFGDAIGRIRRVDLSSGIITTVVGVGIPGYQGDGGPATQARISQPFALAFDRQGNLYFADTGNHCVRRVDRAGRISTPIGAGERGYSEDGTPARRARLANPRGVAVDAAGILYVSDTENNRVLAVRKNGAIVTVAGSRDGGDRGDGGPATRCRLNQPYNLAMVDSRLLLISDHYNNRIRAVHLPQIE